MGRVKLIGTKELVYWIRLGLFILMLTKMYIRSFGGKLLESKLYLSTLEDNWFLNLLFHYIASEETWS